MAHCLRREEGLSATVEPVISFPVLEVLPCCWPVRQVNRGGKKTKVQKRVMEWSKHTVSTFTGLSGGLFSFIKLSWLCRTSLLELGFCSYSIHLHSVIIIVLADVCINTTGSYDSFFMSLWIVNCGFPLLSYQSGQWLFAASPVPVMIWRWPRLTVFCLCSIQMHKLVCLEQLKKPQNKTLKLIIFTIRRAVTIWAVSRIFTKQKEMRTWPLIPNTSKLIYAHKSPLGLPYLTLWCVHQFSFNLKRPLM